MEARRDRLHANQRDEEHPDDPPTRDHAVAKVGHGRGVRADLAGMRGEGQVDGASDDAAGERTENKVHTEIDLVEWCAMQTTTPNCFVDHSGNLYFKKDLSSFKEMKRERYQVVLCGKLCFAMQNYFVEPAQALACCRVLIRCLNEFVSPLPLQLFQANRWC